MGKLLTKVFSLTVGIFLVVLLIGCEKSDNQTPNISSTEVTTTEGVNMNKNFSEYVSNQIELIIRDFWSGRSSQDHPNALSDVMGRGYRDASLWDFGALYTTAMKYYKVTDHSNSQENWELFTGGLEWYRSKNRQDNQLVYTSDNGNEEIPFYDDNVWILLGMLEAYSMTEDEALLDSAKKIQDYIYTGWESTDIGASDAGGLLWREFPKDEFGNYVFSEKVPSVDRNTCINGPAAMSSAILYKITGDDLYLDWAKKIYKWTFDNLRTTDGLGLFNDNIRLFPDGRKQLITTTYTYNQGTMISAGVLLYEITQEEHYLKEAKQTAKFTELLKGVKYPDVEGAVFYKTDEPWFRVYLLQGFLDLARVDEESKGYIERAGKALDYAWEHDRDTRGYLSFNWGKGDDVKMTELRHISGNTEALAIIAEYEKFIKPTFEN
ncbi:MAG: hypothetical protein K0R18_1166 [Bacillales bacterium]|jgi:uncharacterized protein YyaL (SSP411 family)|nr:hypothetical protein [Bacillales bacterium]